MNSFIAHTMLNCASAMSQWMNAWSDAWQAPIRAPDAPKPESNLSDKDDAPVRYAAKHAERDRFDTRSNAR